MSAESTELAGIGLVLSKLVDATREATQMVDEHWKRLHARADDFDALRARLAAAEKKLELKWLIEEQLGAALARAETAERERDEARKSLREHSDVLYDLVKIIDGLDIRMSRRDSDAMSATLLLAEELLEERHED